MNNGFVRPAVATVPTVYGIETVIYSFKYSQEFAMLQQYLPFTVLKLYSSTGVLCRKCRVATVPTVYGIET